MVNQATFEGATLELLRHLRSKKEAIQIRHTQELAEIDREIEAVSITARLLKEAKAHPAPPTRIKTVIPDNLQGKSAREACVEIARANNGVVKVADARNALVSAGILKESKNTWAIVYTTLSRSKDFEKATVGEFRLAAHGVAQEQNLLQ